MACMQCPDCVIHALMCIPVKLGKSCGCVRGQGDHSSADWDVVFAALTHDLDALRREAWHEGWRQYLLCFQSKRLEREFLEFHAGKPQSSPVGPCVALETPNIDCVVSPKFGIQLSAATLLVLQALSLHGGFHICGQQCKGYNFLTCCLNNNVKSA